MENCKIGNEPWCSVHRADAALCTHAADALWVKVAEAKDEADKYHQKLCLEIERTKELQRLFWSL